MVESNFLKNNHESYRNVWFFSIAENNDFKNRYLYLWVFWELSRNENNLFFLSHRDCSVQFICSVVSDSLQPHESQHTRPPCPSPTPRIHSDSRLSSRWCHPAISSSVVPFQWIFRIGFPLGWSGWISLLSKGLSRVFPKTTV